MYATTTELRERYAEDVLAQLTDPTGQAADEARLERALKDASDEIDGYLQARYPLPLARVPRHLVAKTCHVAVYQLQVLRPQGDVEDARLRYKGIIRYLEQVAEGRLQLGLGEDDAPVRSTSGPEVSGGRRLFTRESLRGF